MIQRLILGLNSSSYKAAVLSNLPETLDKYFDLIRRLDQASFGGDPVNTDVTYPNDSVMDAMVSKIVEGLSGSLPMAGSSSSDTRSCSLCGLRGHFHASCPLKRDLGAVPKVPTPVTQGN